ncbi:MAG TPA: hypothetical protein VIK60_07220 [Vicinamibacterales bacterium]
MGTLPSRKTTKRIRKRAPRTPSPSAEPYTPRRLAQFFLENAVDAADYAAARREVRKLGLDPDQIPHEPPSRA